VSPTLDFPDDVGSRVRRALESQAFDAAGATVTIGAVSAEPGDDRDFLSITVAYEVAGEPASITYAVDDWTEGALERSAQAVADGLAALIRAELREQAETRGRAGAA